MELREDLRKVAVPNAWVRTYSTKMFGNRKHGQKKKMYVVRLNVNKNLVLQEDNKLHNVMEFRTP
jgi:hypothetical protein